MEKWVKINGIEYYEFSDQGRVRSLDRYCPVKNGMALHKGRILKFGKDKDGYLQVSIAENGVAKNTKVATLIALAFPEICGERHPGYEISHLDDNRQNNKAENLRWVPHIENCNWGQRNQHLSDSQGKNPIIQYKGDDIIAEWVSSHEIERILGFNHSNINRCCNGKYKSAYGYVWKYKNPSV